MDNTGTVEQILQGLVKLFEPLVIAGEQTPAPNGWYRLAREIGIDLEQVLEDPDSITSKASSMLIVLSEFDNLINGEQLQDKNIVTAAIDALLKIMDMFDEFDSLRVLEDYPEYIGNIGTHIFNYLIIRYLRYYKRKIYFFLLLIGGIQEGNLTQRVPPSVDYTYLTKFLRDPGKIISEDYKWGGREFLIYQLLTRLQGLAWQYGIPALFTSPEYIIADAFSNDIYKDCPDMQLRLPLLVLDKEDMTVQVGIELFPLPVTEPDGDSSLGIIPFLEGETNANFNLPDDWKFTLIASSDNPTSYGMKIGAQDFKIISLDNSVPPARGRIKGSLLHKRTANEATLLIGKKDGTRIDVSTLGASMEFEFGQKNDVYLGVIVQNAVIHIETNDVDGFLQKLLPKNELFVPFDVVVGWSSSEGLTFIGGSALELDLPIHLKIGPIFIEYLHVGIIANQHGNINLSLATTVNVNIGPVHGSIKRIGGLISVEFPADRAGNLGIINLDNKFIPPTGAGLSLDSNAIVGGGFLEFDDPNKRYAGILQLQAGGIELVAIGLIITRMPDGSEGFSLLINIGVVFMPPIELSFAFTLSGVGGLLGYNRTMNVEALREGLRNKALNSIMFPEDPIANANKIISDLRAVFPPAEGRFVVGPMIKLGWGYPNIIQADIGVFIELPDFARVAVLGQLAVGLPIPEKAIIELHIDVLGVLEIPKQRISIDAIIYDSRIYQYTLTGEAALRWSWGDKPVFAMSLGGFHPRFSPPDNFPSLKRLTLNLSQGPDLQLYCKAYQALTSNSVQFGALVDLHASQSGATVQGSLMFDALIYFEPFSFAVAISGNVVAHYKGKQLTSVHITLNLSGPTPWIARGKATFEILVWDVEVGFNKRWGPEVPVTIEAVDPWEKLKTALDAHANWGSRWPDRTGMVEVLADRKEDATNADGTTKPLLLHPSGALEFRQKVLPLGITLDKLGNAPVKEHSRFEVPNVTLGSTTLDPVNLNEDFARGQFVNLSESERLSAPAFEKMTAGVAASSNQFKFNLEWVQSSDKGYESVLIKDDLVAEAANSPEKAKLKSRLGQGQVIYNAARQSPVRRTARRRFETLGKAKTVTVAKPSFSVVESDTLQLANIQGNDGTLGRLQAEQLLKAQGVLGSGRIVVASREVA